MSMEKNVKLTNACANRGNGRPARYRQDNTGGTPMPPDSSPTSPKHGAALIVTLLVLVLLVVIVTGFLSTTRVEQMASRNFTYQAQAQQMAMAGVQKAIAQLNNAFSNNASVTNFTTQPGLILSNGQPIYLSSASVANSGTDKIDLNISNVNLIHSNNFASNTSVYWAPLVLLSNVSNGKTNLAGRYAYWIDDEGTKSNLNAVGGYSNGRTTFLPTNARSFSYKAIGTSGLVDFTNAISGTNTNSWPYFFTGSQLGLLISNRSTTVAYTYSMAGGQGNLTDPLPFMTNGAINLNMMSITDGGGLFTNRLSATVITNIDLFITNGIDRPFITNKFKSSFTDKYGMDVLRQIIANVNDFPLPTNTNIATGAGDLDSNDIPRRFLGLRPFIHLNEIAAAAQWATNATDIQGQLFIQIELINPYAINFGNGADVVVTFDTNKFEGTYEIGGTSTNFTTDAPPSITILTPDVPSTTYSVINDSWVTNYTVSGGAFSNVTITNFPKVKAVKLRRIVGSSQTIQDWAITSDFIKNGDDQLNFTSSEVPFGTYDASLSSGTKGVAKNDPRVRTFPDWTSPTPANLAAWAGVGGSNGNPLTMGVLNSNIVTFSGNAGFPADLSGGATDVTNHPSFAAITANLTTNVVPFNSIMKLGRIHTGLQWRTLQMRAQEAGEANKIPDWALLETFFVSNSIALPKININSIHQQANTNATLSLPISNQATTNVLRQTSLASLLTNAATDTTSVGFDTASEINPANVLPLALNISQIKFNTNWMARRSAHGFSSANTFYSIGEVLEISNVSDFSSSDYINEGRAAAFIDAITVASDTFMIYSYGEAVDASTNAVAEYRCKALVKYNNAEGKFEIITVEPMPLP